VRRIALTAASAAVTGALAGSLLICAPQAGAATDDGTTATGTTTTATTASTAGTTTPAIAPVSWGACDDPTLQAFGATCGSLSVPLDHARPDGPKISLALSMVKHTVPQAQYQGIMLVNPGGPGGSGLVLSILGNFVPKGAGAAYDWIGFDPRGVGASVPALTCDKNYFGPNRPEYVPITPALERTWLTRSKNYAAACATNGGALLDHMRTTDVARDVDAIRASTGQQKLNFYGFSYGTYLGQVYSTLFPQRVRRMVLDSNVDPTRVFYQANLDQDVAFQRNLRIWWAWVAKYDSVYHLGSSEPAVEANWYLEKERLRKKPAGGKVGPDEWTDIFLGAGYYQQTWLDLADLWTGWVKNHDPAPVIAQYESADSVGDDNGFAVYNAVQCTDAVWPRDWNTWRRDNWLTFLKAPFQTWGNAWFNAPCLTWAGKAAPAVNVEGSQVAPILLIDETLDAATPFSGSLEVRKRFPTSRLLAEPGGTSHADSLFGNACVDDQIADYLASGTLPARKPGNGPDTTCDPLPVPVPTATTSAPPSTGASLRSSVSTGKQELLTRLLHQHRL